MRCPGSILESSAAAATLAIVLCAVGASAAGAQAPVVTDLSVEVRVNPAQPLYPPGTVARVTFTVHNHGPDAAAATSIGVPPYAFGGFNDQVRWDAPISGIGCEAAGGHVDPLPLLHGFQQLAVLVPALPAGASHECALSIEIQPLARDTYPLVATVGVPEDHHDPDLSNNRFESPIIITPEGAPLPVTDLAVSISLDPVAARYQVGDEVMLAVSIVNLGTDVAGGAQLRFDKTRAQLAAHRVRLVSQPGDSCSGYLWDSWPAVSTLTLRVPGLRPGWSFDCNYLVRVLDGANGRFSLHGELVPVPDFGSPTHDPHMSNNLAGFTLLFSTAALSRPVPIPLGGWAWTALAVLTLAALAAIALRRAGRHRAGSATAPAARAVQRQRCSRSTQ